MATFLDDNYEHLDPNIDYVLENVLAEEENTSEYAELAHEYNQALVNACSNCTNNCTSSACWHGANYIKAPVTAATANFTELVLDRRRASATDVIYECTHMCSCAPTTCDNRLVQYGPRKHLKIAQSNKYKSKGVFTMRDIPCGGFICEYAGELLTTREAQKRFKENSQCAKMNYILCLRENVQKSIENERNNAGAVLTTIVDPSRKGNIGRYLNHSCDANCEIFSVRVDCPLPKISIFAKRNIQTGEELTFHYNGEDTGSTTRNTAGTPCLCGEVNCSKFLPYNEIFNIGKQ